MKRSFVAACAVLFVVASQGGAAAQAPEDDSALRANCVSDYFKFCSNYQPGTVAIKQCFGRNMRQLTPACRSAIQDFDRRYPRKKGM